MHVGKGPCWGFRHVHRPLLMLTVSVCVCPSAGDAVDIQQACVEEAALLQGPVSALKARLNQLLQEWPEHPVLTQLLAICHRLTGLLHLHLNVSAL